MKKLLALILCMAAGGAAAGQQWVVIGQTQTNRPVVLDAANVYVTSEGYRGGYVAMMVKDAVVDQVHVKCASQEMRSGWEVMTDWAKVKPGGTAALILAALCQRKM